jgi:hypothetical protein
VLKIRQKARRQRAVKESLISKFASKSARLAAKVYVAYIKEAYSVAQKKNDNAKNPKGGSNPPVETAKNRKAIAVEALSGEAPRPRKRRAAAPILGEIAGKLLLENESANSSTTVKKDAAPQPEPVWVPGSYIDRGLPIPDTYGLDRLVALVRDPLCVYGYWDLTGPKLPELRDQRGQAFIDACAWVLRIYRINEDVAVDIEIDPSAGCWYVNVGEPGLYQMELALLSPDGEWISLLVSQISETPLNAPSSVTDDEWRLRPEDEEALKRALGGALDLADAAKRGVSGFLGASRQPGQFEQPSSHSMLGSSASGRPVAGSWAFSFLGASRVSGSGSGSGGFGWMQAPNGTLEPILERPAFNSGPNWNAQPYLPGSASGQPGSGKTQQPHFKVKLPRRVQGLALPKPTWPAAPRPKGRVTRAKAAAAI